MLFTQITGTKPTTNNATNSGTIYELRTGGFKLINPLLDCYEFKQTSLAEYKQLHVKLTQIIAGEIAKKNVESVSLYFRDLNNGPWIGIGENNPYSPASLLKVPYMMAAYYQAQTDPEYLSEKMLFSNQESRFKQSVVDSFSLTNGKSYTIDYLINAMIVHSDNQAKDLVVKSLTDESYFEIFNELGIDIRKQDTSRTVNDFLSVKDYASFFRILYNASFLNKRYSEKALQLLSKTTFKQGIVAGVPDSVVVAHKFGERYYDDTDLKQLHDCGIIYKPKQPYLLCIMTKGKNLETMSKTIATISKLIYSHFK